MSLRRIRQRVFAFGMGHCDGRYRRFLAQHKPELFAGVSGEVLEIGYGAGANLPHLPRDIHYIGIDANPYMERHARAVADNLGWAVELRSGNAGRLEFPSGRFDVVVATLVLCSVPDPAGVLAEIRRVLRPGGRYLFIEHVAAPEGTRTRRWQERTKPIWRVIGDGCSPVRETAAVIRSAGFADVHMDSFRAPVPVFGPHIAGIAQQAAH